jgi:hypothetical protein
MTIVALTCVKTQAVSDFTETIFDHVLLIAQCQVGVNLNFAKYPDDYRLAALKKKE